MKTTNNKKTKVNIQRLKEINKTSEYFLNKAQDLYPDEDNMTVEIVKFASDKATKKYNFINLYEFDITGFSTKSETYDVDSDTIIKVDRSFKCDEYQDTIKPTFESKRYV